MLFIKPALLKYTSYEPYKCVVRVPFSNNSNIAELKLIVYNADNHHLVSRY